MNGEEFGVIDRIMQFRFSKLHRIRYDRYIE